MLISWSWLIDEADEDGLKPSTRQIRQRLIDNEHQNFPGGTEEMTTFLHSTGEDIGDLRREAEAQLASERLRGWVLGKVSKITEVDVARFYATHRQRYAVPEQREVLITNEKTFAAAATLRREVEAGKASPTTFGREIRPMWRNPGEGNRPKLDDAIRRARLNQLTGPVKQLAVGSVSDYFLFIVKRVTPAHFEVYSQVRSVLARQLKAERERQALQSFVAAWRTRWSARTHCGTGYVVQQCKEFHGTQSHESAVEFK